jgi:hypothetical protein
MCLCIYAHINIYILDDSLNGHAKTLCDVNVATQGFRSSSANLSVGPMDIVCHVEAKYPALLFKQQLIAYVEKIFGIIRENVKKDMLQIVPSCIQV